ncbi:unnamed protein product [Brachionus calyciflorus]|uniref:Tudor domain-containing protein n=1 Tax=Brachionus calyciflorus TaxID=104777 RepID=A0A813R571_9BILA|nr:unnamed protein product [Brachionus calyciflorus]
MAQFDKLYIIAKIIKNPSNFCAVIGKISDLDKFYNFQLELNKWGNENQLKLPENIHDLSIRQSVLIKYNTLSNQDSIWKRAKIVTIDNDRNKIGVFLIDDGSFFEKELNEIRIDLPDFYDTFEPQVKLCSLNNVDPQSETNDWSQEGNQFFKHFLSQNGLIANIIEKREITQAEKITVININCFSEIFLVEIFKNEINIRSQLISNGYAKMNTPSYINIDQSSQQSGVYPSDHEHEIDTHKNNMETESEIQDITDTMAKKQQIIETINLDDSDGEDFVFVGSVNNPKILENEQSRSILNSKRSFPSQISLSILDTHSSDSNGSLGSNSSESQGTKKFRISNSFNELKISSNSDNAPNNSSSNNNNNSNIVALNNSDEDDEIYKCTKIDNPNRKILNPRSFVYSDETISTGYRPNIDVDGIQLTRAIKFANKERLNKLMGNERTQLIPKPKLFEPNNQLFGNLKAKEQKIFEILGELTSTLESKSKSLVLFYKQDTSTNSYLIIKCILKEISNSNFSAEQGVELLSGFKFCRDEIFLKAFDQYVNNIELLYSDATYTNLADSDIKCLCELMAKLYLVSRHDTQDISWLKKAGNYCRDKIKSWATLSITKNTQNFVIKRNFKNVRHFLEKCIIQFKMFDYETFQYVYEKARNYTMDNALKEDVKIESFLIVDVYAKEFVKISRSSSDNLFINNFSNSNGLQLRSPAKSFAQFRRNAENQIQAQSQNSSQQSASNQPVFRFAKFNHN